MKIWIDADACPKMIEDVVFKASSRLKIPVCLVANNIPRIPQNNPLVSAVQVEKGLDVADTYIVENTAKNDLVITADIPLAALLVDKGCFAINPRGQEYTEANIRERLSVRDFMQSLRDAGQHTGGPPPLSPKDKARFANAFDRVLTKARNSR